MHIKDFLDPADRQVLVDWAMTNEDRFQPTRIDYGTGAANTRISAQLTDLGPCKDLMRSRLKPRIPEFAEAFGMTGHKFDRVELELVAHGDGAFFKPHTDTGAAGGAQNNRLISAVYYFHNHPKGFEGGELRMFDLSGPMKYVDYQPEDNSLLVFPAFIPHEVRPVTCASGAFKDYRFAINFWAHRAVEDSAKPSA